MHSVSANGAEIPALGFGTWTLKDKQAEHLVASAVEAGYRHIDTASAYDNEVDVGKGIRRSGIDRDELFVTTKVWHTDLADGRLQQSAADSLERLGLDQVDLLLIHWPPTNGPTVEEAVAALNDAKDRGYARHIGVSNFPTALLARALAVTRHPLVANQCEYHPWLNQDRVLAAVRAACMAFVSYCPLARAGDAFSEPAIADAARAHGRTPAQIVLRWHVQQPGVVAIPRTSNEGRARENIAIFDFELGEDEMSRISALGKQAHRICDFQFGPQWDPV